MSKETVNNQTTEPLFLQALRCRNHSGKLPVWMMRQAGRYHPHYQHLRSHHSFRDLCIVPEFSCETTLGPIEDYHFDAAILFSDILFSLEACGVPVTYPNTGPELGFKIYSRGDTARLVQPEPAFFSFQQEACRLLKQKLPADVPLIGFAGSPWTLFVFLTEGTYKVHLGRARALYNDGTFDAVAPLLEAAIFWSLLAQRRGGADVFQVFDSAAGLLTPDEYAGSAFRSHKRLLLKLKTLCPDLIFFAKGATSAYEAIRHLDWTCLSIDWNWNLQEALRWVGPERAVQGNFHSDHLFYEPQRLQRELIHHFSPVAHAPNLVANLGHGVLPMTPPENVRLFVNTIHGLSERQQ